MRTPDIIPSSRTYGSPCESSNPVARAFDSIAPRFDAELENEITVVLRRRVYSVVESLVDKGASIIDINCGTGIDAMYFAKQGNRVTAIDVSTGMISEANRKMGTFARDNPRFLVGSFERLSPDALPPADLTFSNFGGLDCTNDLSLVAEGVAAITKPGGYFVGVIMPRFSLWESLAYLLRGQFLHSIRRFKAHTPATGFGQNSFPVRYYSPRQVRLVFKKYFSLKGIIGLNIVSPTPQSVGFVRRHPHLTKVLRRVEGLIESVPPLRSFGDHYIIILQRR